MFNRKWSLVFVCYLKDVPHVCLDRQTHIVFGWKDRDWNHNSSFLAMSLRKKLATTVTVRQDDLWVAFKLPQFRRNVQKKYLRREILSVPYRSSLRQRRVFSAPHPIPLAPSMYTTQWMPFAPNPNPSPNQTESFAGHALSGCPF